MQQAQSSLLSRKKVNNVIGITKTHLSNRNLKAIREITGEIDRNVAADENGGCKLQRSVSADKKAR